MDKLMRIESTRLTPDEAETLVRIAASEDRHKAEILRYALRSYFDHMLVARGRQRQQGKQRRTA